MIRRHFLAGVVGIKALCVAAALAVGVGQAEAATYNVSVTMTDYSLSCVGSDCQYIPKPDRPSWKGLVLDQTVNGVLSITEVSERDWSLALNLDNGGQVFGASSWWGNAAAGSWGGLEFGGGVSYQLTWDGLVGGFQYASDGFAPWFEEVGVTMALREDLAPVPLPVTAALLPMGIGTLAMLRRRRKA